MKTIMLTALLLSGIAAGTNENQMDKNKANTIEVVIFQVKKGVSDKVALEKAATVNDFISKQKGFVSRNLSKIEDGKWLDIVYWESLEEAKAASENAMKSEETVPFFSIIKESSMQFFHADIKISID